MLRMLLPLFILLLASCGKSAPVEYKPLYFSQYQPIYLNVSSIEVVEEYKSSMRPPFIEHLIPYSPAEAMRIWVRDRLRSTGGDNKTMQVIVKNGGVMATTASTSAIPLVPGETRYDAKLEVEIRIYGANVISEASIFVNATRTLKLPSGANDRTKQIAFRKLIADMMDEFNAEMEKNLFMYMGKYISYSYSP